MVVKTEIRADGAAVFEVQDNVLLAREFDERQSFRANQTRGDVKQKFVNQLRAHKRTGQRRAAFAEYAVDAFADKGVHQGGQSKAVVLGRERKNTHGGRQFCGETVRFFRVGLGNAP